MAHSVAASSTPANSAKSATPCAIVTSVPSLCFSSKTRLCCSSQRRFQRKFQANNLSSTFGVREIPVDSSCATSSTAMTISPSCPASPTGSVACSAANGSSTFQIFDARYLITLDGSRYFSSESVHCAHCLTTTKNGTTRYHHDILQAAIVHPDQRQVLPLAPEFVRNSDADGGNYRKQDCEITAGYRMLARLRADYPRMAAIIVADSLYSKQPFVEQLTAQTLLVPAGRQTR